MDFLEGEILTVGQKLKKIRKYLGAKQEDITGGKITRSLISYIENDKTNLTHDTAIILTGELNKFAREKKMNFTINVEYLLESVTKQLEKSLDEAIVKLKNIIEQSNCEELKRELEKIDTLLLFSDMPEKEMIIYTLSADFYYSQKDYTKSYFYNVKSLENAIKCGQIIKMVEIIFRLGLCEMKLGNYAQAVNFNSYAKVILEGNKLERMDLVNRCDFNNSLAYKKLEEYDKCLAILDNLEARNTSFTYNQKIDILTLRGNCYSNKGQTHTARKTYQQVINLAEEHNNLEALATAYVNISDSFDKDGNISKSVEFDIKCLEIREKINSNSIFMSLFSLGKKYLKINELDLSKKCLIKAVKEAKKYNNMNVVFQALNHLLSIYIRSYDDASIDLLIEEIDKIREDSKNSTVSNFDVIYFKASYYYINKDVEKSRRLLRVGLDINDTEGLTT